jgi:hypothetical protein
VWRGLWTIASADALWSAGCAVPPMAWPAEARWFKSARRASRLLNRQSPIPQRTAAELTLGSRGAGPRCPLASASSVCWSEIPATPCGTVVGPACSAARGSARSAAQWVARPAWLAMALAESPSGHQLKIWRHPIQLAVCVWGSDEWGLIGSR